MGAGGRDELSRAMVNLAKAASVWKAETTDVHCEKCGFRVGRRKAEILLYEAVSHVEKVARDLKAASEAPTLPRGRRIPK